MMLTREPVRTKAQVSLPVGSGARTTNPETPQAADPRRPRGVREFPRRTASAGAGMKNDDGSAMNRHFRHRRMEHVRKCRRRSDFGGSVKRSIADPCWSTQPQKASVQTSSRAPRPKSALRASTLPTTPPYGRRLVPACCLNVRRPLASTQIPSAVRYAADAG